MKNSPGIEIKLSKQYLTQNNWFPTYVILDVLPKDQLGRQNTHNHKQLTRMIFSLTQRTMSGERRSKESIKKKMGCQNSSWQTISSFYFSDNIHVIHRSLERTSQGIRTIFELYEIILLTKLSRCSLIEIRYYTTESTTRYKNLVQ